MYQKEGCHYSVGRSGSDGLTGEGVRGSEMKEDEGRRKSEMRGGKGSETRGSEGRADEGITSMPHLPLATAQPELNLVHSTRIEFCQ